MQHVWRLIIATIVFYLFAIGCLTLSEADDSQPTLDPQPFYWYERGVRKQAWLATDEIAAFGKRSATAETVSQNSRNSSLSIANPVEQTPFMSILQSPQQVDRSYWTERLPSLRSVAASSPIFPVFYTSSAKQPSNRMVPTGQVIVQYPGHYNSDNVRSIESDYQLVRANSSPIAPNTFLYQAGDGLQALTLSTALCKAQGIIYAYPNWYRGHSLRTIPDDLLFPSQWHLNNSGQNGGVVGEDVHICDVWDTYRGSPQTVIAVVDDGLKAGHDDLKDNLLPGESWDYVDGDTDPSHSLPFEGHGTQVAGVAAGRGFNQIGISGAAPLAGLVGHRLMGASTDVNIADALTRRGDLIGIYSNSWGVPDWNPTYEEVDLAGPSPLVEDALLEGIRNGRQGLGCIYVWAGGNGYDQDNSNYDGYANSRFTIAVAASTNKGRRAIYSERGANIMVTAPSGDIAPGDGSLRITTTDAYRGYTSTFNGTSAAAPLVAGIIALMLDANPNLTWRDVQHILIETAEMNDPDDSDWARNGAAYWVNHKYGFGRVDALAAVQAAETWISAASETSIHVQSVPNLPTADLDETGISDTISVTDDIIVEFVEVYFTATDHPSWSDLEITLISPAGTRSVLAQTSPDGVSGTRYDKWRFGTVRCFGESSLGEWSLQVRDLAEGNTGTFQSWTLAIYGSDVGSSPAAVRATTGSALDATATSATLTGQIATDEGSIDYYFEYGPSAEFGFSTRIISLETNVDTVSVTTYVNGLTPETTFHYRLVAETQSSRSMGLDEVFTTRDTSEVEAFVTRLYEQCLNRSPDPVGLNYWVEQLLNGTSTGADIVRGFLLSPELSQRNLSDGDYVRLLYSVFIDRDPEPAESEYWLYQLSAGTNRDVLVARFAVATEFRYLCRDYGITSDTTTAFVTRFYQQCLNRAPDPAGLDDWVDGLQTGRFTGADIAAGFLLSQEFSNKHLADDDYIQTLYTVLLNRDPDDEGFNYWRSRFQLGASRRDILSGFMYSPEYSNLSRAFGISPY